MKSKLLNFLFRAIIVFLSIYNYRKQKLLIYTDSRGHNVNSKFGKNNFDSYIYKLAFSYNVKCIICPEKYTTIIDFFDFIGKHNLSNYDYVICHCGVVDFSPRPLSSLSDLYYSKHSASFTELSRSNKEYYSQPFSTQYKGEPTINLYSKQFCLHNVIPKLKSIHNLIWIGSNRFAEGWEGNYSKGRPKNIDDVVAEYNNLIHLHLSKSISLLDWNSEEIKSFTIDNIHFSDKGFNEIYHRILSLIKTTVK